MGINLFIYILGPAAPSDVQITFNSGALEATFSVAEADGSSNYTVLLYSGDTSLNCTMSVSPCAITSLQCGTEYAVSLVATNEAGSTLSPKTWSLLSGVLLLENYKLEDLFNAFLLR